MKTTLRPVGVILCIMLAFSSCTIQKRHHNRGFHVEWLEFKRPVSKPITSKATKDRLTTPDSLTTVYAGQWADLDLKFDLFDVSQITNPIVIPISSNQRTIFISDSVKCDILILKSGEEIEVKVTEVGEEIIKYKRCDNLDGPIFTKRVTEVFMIKYPNGTKSVFNAESIKPQSIEKTNSGHERPSSTRNPKVSQIVPMSSVFSLISGIVGLFVFALPLGILAIILGLIGFTKANKEPNSYKGGGMAIAGIALGFLDIVLLLVLLTLL